MFHPSNQSSNTEYYDTLGVNKNSDLKQIKKAYRNLAKKYHPDKVTDDSLKEEYTAKFQKIGEAYEVLSDPEKRKTYDQFGKEGLNGNNGNGNGNVNMNDIFQSMFGGGGGGFSFNQQRRTQNNNFMKKRQRKSAPVVHQVNISLEDLFNGRTIKFKITKKTIIDLGSNNPVTDKIDDTWTTCKSCNGNGAVMETRQVAPGFMTQTQKPCGSCGGTGHGLKPGYQLKDYPVVVEVEVKKGMNPRAEHVIVGGGNCYPGAVPGDIIIAFQIVPHPMYTLVGSNLSINKKILLSEALCGFSFEIVQLDGKSVRLKSKNIIKPGTVRTIPELGMVNMNGMRGYLTITFDIEFPDTLLIHQKQNLKKYLPRLDSEESNQGPVGSNGSENDTNIIII